MQTGLFITGKEMKLVNKSRNYEKVSEIYDFIMRNVRYDIWANYVLNLSKDNISENSSVLELGAGNCHLANLLAGSFPHLIAADISQEMLMADKLNLVKKVCCDMSYLPFRGKYDLIYCTFDSINYLTSKKKLLSLFKEIERLISSNGIFTFDASLENNSLKHIRQPLRKGLSKNIEYLHKSEYSKVSRIHKNFFSLKYKDRTYVEIHKQKIYPFEVYFQLINSTNLYVSHCYKTFTFIEGTPDSDRVQFIVRKEQ
jgi:ubiquinone/menaquinone biosynthesis C-methylase UbiE